MITNVPIVYMTLLRLFLGNTVIRGKILPEITKKGLKILVWGLKPLKRCLKILVWGSILVKGVLKYSFGA